MKIYFTLKHFLRRKKFSGFIIFQKTTILHKSVKKWLAVNPAIKGKKNEKGKSRKSSQIFNDGIYFTSCDDILGIYACCSQLKSTTANSTTPGKQHTMVGIRRFLSFYIHFI
jgi:hypothetical protein